MTWQADAGKTWQDFTIPPVLDSTAARDQVRVPLEVAERVLRALRPVATLGWSVARISKPGAPNTNSDGPSNVLSAPAVLEAKSERSRHLLDA
eukprot:4986817-Heterocapsa_arctica.AAC.1